jgi:signal transduction histidine kinase
LLPRSTWAALALVLLACLGLAAYGEWASQSWSRAGLLLLTLSSIALITCLALLLRATAQREQQRRTALEGALRELEARTQERTRELSALSTYLQELSERERLQLAHELHDELGGLLTAAKMDLSWLHGRIAQQPPVLQRLQQLAAVLDDAMDVKRRVVEELRPSLLDHFGLPTALRAHVESACAKAGLECRIVMPDEATMPKATAIALFRVVQAALDNVIRHAHAHHVTLELDGDEQGYRLALDDDGQGFAFGGEDSRWPPGLAGMRQRISALGGRLDLQSTPGLGTRLRIELPLRRAAL